MWPVYEGQDYVLDMAMWKMRKGRQKKKHFHNEIDDMEKGYDNDMYGSGDLDQMRNKVHCSVCQGEGTPWIDKRKGQRGTQGRVVPRVKIIDQGQPLS
jgi:hypothetical protein